MDEEEKIINKDLLKKRFIDNGCMQKNKRGANCRKLMLIILRETYYKRKHGGRNYKEDFDKLLERNFDPGPVQQSKPTCCGVEMISGRGVYNCRRCKKEINDVFGGGGVWMGPGQYRQTFMNEKGNEMDSDELRRLGIHAVFYDQDPEQASMYRMSEELRKLGIPGPLVGTMVAKLHGVDIGRQGDRRKAIFAMLAFQISDKKNSILHWANTLKVPIDYVRILDREFRELFPEYKFVNTDFEFEVQRGVKSPTRGLPKEYDPYAKHVQYLENLGFTEAISLAYVVKNIMVPGRKRLTVAMQSIADHYGIDKRLRDDGVRDISKFLEENRDHWAEFYSIS